MSEFFGALFDPDLAFLRHALGAGLLASIAFGVIGAYVVARRITYVAAAISHSLLGGIGLALYLSTVAGIKWLGPDAGALVAALLAALVLASVARHGRQREDSTIGTVWTIGMAVGLLCFFKTPGYIDPMSYLFGDILMIGRRDVWLVAGLDVLVVGVGVYFYRELMAVCFDEEFARLRGVPARAFYLLLLGLTAVTVVLMVKLVGIVMLIALLTLPAAIAGRYARRLWQMMLGAVVLCMIFVFLGLGISYQWDLPSGPTIILLAATVYLAQALIEGWLPGSR